MLTLLISGPQPEPDPEPDSETYTEPNPKPDSETYTELDPEPDSETYTEPDPEPDPEPDSETYTEPDPKPEPQKFNKHHPKNMTDSKTTTVPHNSNKISKNRDRMIPERLLKSSLDKVSVSKSKERDITLKIHQSLDITNIKAKVTCEHYKSLEDLRIFIYDNIPKVDKKDKKQEHMQVFIMGQSIENYLEFHDIQDLFDAIPYESFSIYYIYWDSFDCRRIGMYKGEDNKCHYQEYEMTDFSIQLPGYKFNLKVRFSHEGRFYVLIHNVTEGLDFICYMSCSQGLWRLCVREEYNDNRLYKGNNYTTSSIISFELQKFIMAHYSDLKEIEYENIHCIHTNDILKRQIDRQTENLDIHNTIHDDTYVHINKYTTKKTISQKEVLDRAVSLQNHFDIPSEVVDVYDYTVPPLHNIDYKEMVNIASNDLLDENTQDYYYNILDNLIRMHISLKCVNLNSQRYQLRMYYLRVTDIISGFGEALEKKIDGSYNIPVLILPQSGTENINQYGLYNKQYEYTEYVHKPFEYTHQCTAQKCSGQYSFLGKFWNDVFPFKQIYEHQKRS